MLSEQDINNIDIKYIALLDTDEAAGLYMEKMFNLWTEVIVVSLEGKYPEHPALRARVLQELKTNPDLYCVTFGARAVKELEVVTRRVLHMADFFIVDLTNFEWQRPKFELDEDRIVALMQAFCNKFANTAGMDRLNAYNSIINYFNNSTIPNQKNSLKWYHNLLKS